MDDESSVHAFLAGITPDKRRRDGEALLELMGRVTGEPARLWGSIVGFGHHHYRYASGREGDTPAVGFAPRKAATTLYLVDGVQRHAPELERLGPHTTGASCLYVKDLAAVDLDVLEAVIASSYRSVIEGGPDLQAETPPETPAP